MPEQGSRRGVGITNAPFTQAFDTPVLRFAKSGLNLVESLDQVDISRLTNLIGLGSIGAYTVREGLTALATGGTILHSVRRINAPRTLTFTRVWGADDTLYAGASGALAAIDSGYSGDPLTLVPYRPPLSADAWMFVGDRTRTRKVRASDNLDLPISPVAPTLAVGATLDTEQRTPICAFDDSDGTQASAWTGTAGFGFNDTAGTTDGPVEIFEAGGLHVGDIGVHFGCLPGDLGDFAPDGFWYMAGLPKTLDLSQTGIYPADDQDLIHLNVDFSHVDLITEVRIYFVISEDFSATQLPGSAGTTNGDFYVKSITPNDFGAALLLQKTMLDAAEDARIRAIRDASLASQTPVDHRPGWAEQRAQIEIARARTVQGPAGNDVWSEIGVLGLPLRRGDWKRVGATPDRDWSTVTGIIVFVSTGPKSAAVAVRLDDFYMTGGSGPDTSEAGFLQLDYRYTHYDPRTGDETNGSPEQDASVRLDSLRRAVNVTPQAYGDADVRQRFYRRGGSLSADWYYLGANESDGAAFLDRLTDAAIVAAGTLELDNDPFLTTLDADGSTVRSAPAAVIFGPIEDLLLATGNPYEPGHVFWSKAGRPGSWPAAQKVEVCPPSEELMNGGLWGGQAFVFSRERLYFLYPNLGGQTEVVASAPSNCARGLLSRWALVVTPAGIAFLNEDGIYLTTGGAAGTPISRPVDPLFHGQSVNGYRPIDLSNLQALRLEYANQELWFVYADDQGTRQALIYDFLTQAWRHALYGPAINVVYSDEGDTDGTLIFGGRGGTAYTQGGFTDDGTPIEWRIRTGAVNFGRPREDKLLGDLILDCDRGNADMGLRTFLNEETVANDQLLLNAGVGRQRYIIDPFGVSPQKARTLSVHLSGIGSNTARATLFQIGGSVIPQPDLTVNRVTQWDDLGHPDEVYLTGLTIDVDTGNATREFLVEYDLGGVWFQLGPYSVTANNRHKFKFSWPVVKANLVRIRPIGDCLAWILYRADWIFDPEPPRVAGWDINVENGWDQYFTGVDLDCNTFGATKTVDVSIDGTSVLTAPVLTTSRRVVHLTIQPPVRGHLFRFVATDSNPGLLYSHRIQSDPEPSEQTNFSQNYTIQGALDDKYLKGLLIECDTFGQNKALTIEIDGVVVETLTLNTDGRKVVQFSFPQHLGRVFRMLPIDSFPGRLYSHQFIFDQEPLALARWETQLLDHNILDFQTLLYAHVTIKATRNVVLTITVVTNESQRSTEMTYTIPHTSGLKRKQFLRFRAIKGVQFKYVFTSDQPFYLYREETTLVVQGWAANQQVVYKPFGNDDSDSTRSMVNSMIAASRSGGGTS